MINEKKNIFLAHLSTYFVKKPPKAYTTHAIDKAGMIIRYTIPGWLVRDSNITTTAKAIVKKSI
jgi:hypothetical protein